jgi:hypothetical protein
MVYSGLQNKYSCTQCQCAATIPRCYPWVGLYLYNCSGSTSIQVQLDATMCVNNGPSGTMNAEMLDPGTPVGPAGCSVAAGGGILTGSAMLLDPVTVCCSG